MATSITEIAKRAATATKEVQLDIGTADSDNARIFDVIFSAMVATRQEGTPPLTDNGSGAEESVS
jgi:hypothetical protein